MNRLFTALLASALLFTVNALQAAEIKIDKNSITVFGTLFDNRWPLENTIDDDLSTFWHGTNNIQIGMTDYLAYHFNASYKVSRIDFWIDVDPNLYRLGELDIQVSEDSTDGFDGSWTTVEHIDGDFNPTDGDFSISLDIDPTSWIRLSMNYQGRAAYGSSPAFALSELDFYSQSDHINDLMVIISELDETAFKNNAEQRRRALLNKIYAIIESLAVAEMESDPVIQDELYQETIDKFLNDIQAKMDGCPDIADNNDWVTDCSVQNTLNPIIDNIVADINDLKDSN